MFEKNVLTIFGKDDGVADQVCHMQECLPFVVIFLSESFACTPGVNHVSFQNNNSDFKKWGPVGRSAISPDGWF